jgi:hypothetical protein
MFRSESHLRPLEMIDYLIMMPLKNLIHTVMRKRVVIWTTLTITQKRCKIGSKI